MTIISRITGTSPRQGLTLPARPFQRRRSRPSVLPMVAVLLILPIGAGYMLLRPPPPFTPSFAGPDRLVTNQRAFHHPDMPGVRQSEDWSVTSGSLFARDGAGWTGEPDRVLPDAASTNGTGSGVFRVVSNRDDFRDVRVSLRLRIEALTELAETHAYDGAHMFLRYQSPDELYGVTMFRRDGTVAVKRKSPGETEGEGNYVTLASAQVSPPMNTWVHVVARVVTLNSGSVRITLSINGDQVLEATDPGRRGDPIKNAGRVGLRGDNCQFSFDRFRAEEIR